MKKDKLERMIVRLQTPKTENFIQAASGKAVDFLDASPDQILIEDIAHALSLLCRFGGHCTKFYSVCEHSVRCSWRAPKGFELEALLHDASEAYLVDIPRPIKILLPEYKIIEEALEKIISKKFGIPFPMSPEVKEIDNRMLSTEASQIMNKSERPWTYVFPIFKTENIEGWAPKKAYDIFMARFNYLTQEQKQAA